MDSLAILAPFWETSWNHVGHLSRPKTAQEASKTLARRLQDASKTVQVDSKDALDRPRSPKTAQDASKPAPEASRLRFFAIFDRCLVVLGRHLGVIFGTFGGQVGPRSVQNASWKLIFVKNVKIHQILRPLIPERKLGPQDGLQNAPRSAQDGSKTVLESNLFGLEIRLKF